MICVALTTTERDVIAIAFQPLEDRTRNNAFDLHLEWEFACDPAPPACGVGLMPLSRFA
jgi:hypothetical protein